MATSSIPTTSSFVATQSQIILRALRIIGAIASGETPQANETSDATFALQAMVKGWETTGFHVWKEGEAILWTQPNQYRYLLGPGSTDQWGPAFISNTARQTASYLGWVQPTISTTAAASASSFTVSSIANIGNGDNFGVTLDSGSIYWSTVNGAPTGSTVNIVGSLPSSASTGAVAYDYPAVNPVIRPLRIPRARRYNFPSAIETPLIVQSRSDYMDMPNKSSAPGTITQLFYGPLIGSSQLGPAEAFVWPSPQDSTNGVRFTWQQPINDFTNPGDLGDFPQEWTAALIWNLADELAPEYGVPSQRLNTVIRPKAAQWLDLCRGWDRDDTSVQFGVAVDQTGRGN